MKHFSSDIRSFFRVQIVLTIIFIRLKVLMRYPLKKFLSLNRSPFSSVKSFGVEFFKPLQKLFSFWQRVRLTGR